ncbi:hypothetical protein [Flavilitoribacter nigricans]|uniref:LPXTG cell wall anchor domain-containing protein n=1 Tax=Flavilitoribacter nigricans (strain ATCC 23147 / DSM 23189 / NBRC 102662 / NCIMB 1420 / SS-2) TaxID=1122177 RepID=A0A2D0ND02_FLAN2|nr:hypothetical protein [Flavilitoribacter nigricans]PHN06382.1 hypothetical protein CRP01_12495 [Flavilitoribacter nigricans DSM 23189 = NBRC 102662]
MKSNQPISSDTLLIMLLTLIFPIMHRAQSSSESVYSDQAFDPIRTEVWYEDPFIWGAVIILAGIGFFWLRRRK